MALLKIKVPCVRCGQQVDKLDARKLSASATGETRYECFSCFKKVISPQRSDRNRPKRYFCERCRYGFSAPSALCPYCSKADRVVIGTPAVHDFL